jgi:hypothetical protein
MPTDLARILAGIGDVEALMPGAGGTLMPQNSARRAERALGNPNLDVIEIDPTMPGRRWAPFLRPGAGEVGSYTPLTPHYFMEADDDLGITGRYPQEGGRRLLPIPPPKRGY